MTGNLMKAVLKWVCRPEVLILDEIGYIPIDKHGAYLLFQVISRRYERGSILLTSNKAYKDWGEIFNQDQTVISAILDRLHHHVTAITLAGKNYRMGREPRLETRVNLPGFSSRQVYATFNPALTA